MGHGVPARHLGLTLSFLSAIIFASSSFRKPDLQPKANRSVTVAEAYAPATSVPVVAARASAVQQLVPPMLRSVLKDILRSPESSKIFYFLLLNLAYMFIQLLWGVWTNSLGLISDAIHMVGSDLDVNRPRDSSDMENRPLTVSRLVSDCLPV